MDWLTDWLTAGPAAVSAKRGVNLQLCQCLRVTTGNKKNKKNGSLFKKKKKTKKSDWRTGFHLDKDAPRGLTVSAPCDIIHPHLQWLTKHQWTRAAASFSDLFINTLTSLKCRDWCFFFFSFLPEDIYQTVNVSKPLFFVPLPPALTFHLTEVAVPVCVSEHQGNHNVVLLPVVFFSFFFFVLYNKYINIHQRLFKFIFFKIPNIKFEIKVEREFSQRSSRS